MAAARLFAAGALLAALVTVRAQAAIIVVDNLDLPGEGFNDLTPAVPVGGNTGTTLGQQRLIAVQYGADLWGSILASDVTIRVAARFNRLSCTSSTATLGTAGSNALHRDFSGAPVPGTYYAAALADKLAGMDLDPGNPDIVATFNSAFDDGSCTFACKWYYGLDASPAPPGCKFDLVTVVLHELGHGLGFFSTVDRATGAKLNGFDDAFMRFLEDHTTGKLYPAMTNAERAAASKSMPNLHWVGPSVVDATGSKTGGVGPMGHAQMYAPATLSGSSVSHWSTTMTPQEVLEPFFTTPWHDPGLAVEALVDEGWTLLACGDGLVDPGEQCDDGNRAPGDGCSAACTVESCRTCSGEPSVCTPRADGTSCSDGVFCNGADQCRAGSCTVHAGSPCPGPDGDGDCAESCDEAADDCTAADPDGSACNDGDACTSTDACGAGVCAGTTITCTNHFLCYKAKTTKTFTFTPVIGASLSDQFDAAFVFEVIKPKRLCSPVDQDGEGVPDPATHETGYQLVAQETTPKHVSRTRLTVRNQFGDIGLDTVKPDFLLVPTATNSTTDPPPPGPNQADNYKCYKVRVTPGTAKFPTGTTAMVADQFTSPAKSLDVIKPSHLCTPVDLNGSGIKHPLIHQLCYKVKLSRGAPKHIPQIGLHVNNGLAGVERLDTQKEEFLCVPSLEFHLEP
jgi:cysteine-rich repeat protein